MIAFGLNVILGVLLMCGLMIGMRLDKRLRGLRDNHEGFAKAVQELDQAALRTEASLAALRAGAETARTELAARIDQARLLTQRLDKLMVDADRALTPSVASHRPHAAVPSAEGARRSVADPALRPAALAERRPHPRIEPRAEARPQPAIDPRSRVRVDDDLFDIGGGVDRPRAALMGGRR